MNFPIVENMSKKTLSLLSFGVISLFMALHGLMSPNLGHSALDSITISYENQLNGLSQKYRNDKTLKTAFDQSLDEYQKTDTAILEDIMYDLHIEREALKNSLEKNPKKAQQLEMISDAVLYVLLKRSYQRY